MKTAKLIIPALFLLIIGAINGCKKTSGKSALKVYMTDAPAQYEEVNVELRRVDIHYKQGGWVSVATNTGIYDLLTLQNGVSTMIVDDNDVPAGDITEIRLILGNDNSIKISGEIYPLIVPSGYQTGIKIKVNKTLAVGGLGFILIDFDAKESVVHTGDGSYLLKPVIKVMD